MALLTIFLLTALIATKGEAHSVNHGGKMIFYDCDEFTKMLSHSKPAARLISLRPEEAIETVLSGKFYALDTLSGQTLHRLNRRHLGSFNDSHVMAMRLDLGAEVPALDMELSQDSAWTEDSQVVVRRGEQVEEVLDAVDSSCFLSGRLTSHAGAVSLNRCGRMSGLVQTNDHVYTIEDVENGSLDSSIKVTMKRLEDMTSSEDGIVRQKDLFGLKERSFVEDISKRQQQPITAEVAVFVDANFARWMANNRGRRTDAALANWVAQKWNVVRSVYGNAPVVGVPFTVQLKKVEIWRTNPGYYASLGNNARTVTYLSVFCRQSPSYPNYDHKMLYTQGTGQHHMGVAFVNQICRPTGKCSLSKAKAEDVRFELHEFGHNLGFKHDPKMQPCTDPSGEGGFMGWYTNYRFLDCYRRRLLQTIREPGARCLYQRNVNLPTLNK